MATGDFTLEDKMGTEETINDAEGDAQEYDEGIPEMDEDIVRAKPTSKADKLKEKLRRLRVSSHYFEPRLCLVSYAQ